MRNGWDFAGRGTSALHLALWLVVSVSGCKVYKPGLLDQSATAAGAPGLAGANAGGGAPSQEAGNGGTDGGAAGKPPQCSGGECWWSGAATEACRSAGLPTVSDRPSGGDDSTREPEIYLGFTQIRLGTQAPDGEPSEDAWASFGFDLDGVCTNSETCEGSETASCRSAGPAVPFDGQLCRDNTLARLLPMITIGPELGETFGVSEATFNCQLWRGGYNMLARISDYNGQANDDRVRVDYYLSTGIEDPLRWDCPMQDFRARYPRWSASRTWAVDDRTLTEPVMRPGSLPDSKFADAEAYVRDGYLVARVPDGTEQGFLGDGKPYHGFVFKSRQGLFVGRLSKVQDGTWELTDGLIGGRIQKDDLVRSFRETGFCEAGDVHTFYQIMLDLVDDAVDVLANGESSPSERCDALSYGFAFEAAQLTPGRGVTAPPRVECCAPGESIEDCMAACGDGKVNGDEKCDTAIAEGAEGACPTQCDLTEACVPRMLTGSECATECKELPVSVVGARDACCPPGANLSTDPDCQAQCGNGTIETGETCDPPMSCKSCASNACFSVRTTGSAENCNTRCEYTPISECTSGDGCCPAGCNADNDDDCPASCGNGTLDPGETCENGTNRPCPTNCDDGKACTVDRVAGSAENCSLTCSHAEITEARNDDGCCPPAATANSDDDCMPRCGNGAVEGNEECDDGNEDDGDGCVECGIETDQTVCLSKLGSDDACARCTCTKCPSEGLACYDHDDATDARLCRDLVECSYANECGQPDCYCGTVSLFGCFAGAANGECRRQVERAAKTESILEIESRSADRAYPLGVANALFTCVERRCAAECNRN